MNKLLAKIKHKKEAYRGWKQGQVTWVEYRNTVQMSRDEVRKAEAQMKLSLARDIKENKKGFCQHVGNKRKTRENVDPLLSETGDPVTQGMEKAEILNVFFASVFLSKTGLWESQVTEIRGKG